MGAPPSRAGRSLEVAMKRTILQFVLVLAIAGGAYAGWQALGELMARQEARMAIGGPTRVAVAEARNGRVTERVESVGTTRAREAVDVVSQLSGRVVAINFEEGQAVPRGMVLVELDRVREQAELREAVALRDDAARQLQRARQLLQTQNVPEARVDELRAALEAAEARVAVIESTLEDKLIRAPFDGVVGLREISPGAFVQPQQRVTTLDDVSSLRLDFSIPERFVGLLSPGLRVEARSAAYPGQVIAGQVTRIDTRVDPVTRALRVQAELPNNDGRLRPGMFLSVGLTVSERSDAVLVPEAAVVTEGERSYVYVIADGKAERRDVRLGLRMAGEVEIREGLATGEQVVTLGLQRVRDGAEVEVVEESGVQAGS